jgi:DNA invertase Pin-like site-specific DNA recombinase
VHALTITNEAAGMRALIYTRVSKDLKQRGRSVAEQERECRALCDRERWDVAHVVVDNHRSASRYAKREREGWERVKQLIVSRSFEVLVTWEASRTQRDLDAYVELRKLCEASGVLWSYSGTTYDMRERSDRFRTGLDALVSEDEAERTRERILRTVRSNALQGRPHGRRLYGYERFYDPASGELLGQRPHPHEAEVVREIAHRFLAGDTTYAIAADLNSRGIFPPPTKRHGETIQPKWSLERLRQLLVRPSYAGFRQHNDDLIDGTWEPIIDRDTFTKIQAKLDDPARQRNRERRDITHLLTGIARCGKCGAFMYRGHDRKRRYTYVCRAGVGHLARDMRSLDAFVTGLVLQELANPSLIERLSESVDDPRVVDARERARALRVRLEEATDEFTSGALSAGTLAKIEAKLMPEIERAEREARASVLPTTLPDIAGPDADACWDALTIVAKRDVIRTLFTITVLPALPGRRKFDPTFVRVERRF